MYDEPQNQIAPQPQYTPEQLYQMQQEEAYYAAGDPWAKQRNNDPAIQVREALYDAVDVQHSDKDAFEKWANSRRLMLTRASRIAGIDIGTIRRFSRKFKYIVARAHSEGKGNILRSMCETFDFEMELMVSRGDMEMKGISGITSMISQNVNQKQEVRMPQQQAPPSIFSGITDRFRGGK